MPLAEKGRPWPPLGLGALCEAAMSEELGRGSTPAATSFFLPIFGAQSWVHLGTSAGTIQTESPGSLLLLRLLSLHYRLTGTRACS